MANVAERKQQFVREVHRIVEMRDGCIFATESLGLFWCDSGLVKAGHVIGSVGAKHGYLFRARLVIASAPEMEKYEETPHG